MDKQEMFRKNVKAIYRSVLILFSFAIIVSGLFVYIMVDPGFSMFKTDPEPEQAYAVVEELDEDLIENGIHLRTGLVEADGLMEVVNNCTSCHSARIVIQNRMNKERWAATIDWMQQTQNLWDLGGNEEIIIDYLVTNYPPTKKGRRQNLSAIDWYELE